MIQNLQERLLAFSEHPKQFMKDFPNLGAWLKDLSKEELEYLWHMSNKVFVMSQPEEPNKVGLKLQDYLDRSQYLKQLYEEDIDVLGYFVLLTRTFTKIERDTEPNQHTIDKQMWKLCELINIYWHKKLKKLKIKGPLMLTDKNHILLSDRLYKMIVELRETHPEIFDGWSEILKNPDIDFLEQTSVLNI